MPIDYKKYPANWKEFSRRIRFERAKNVCEKCAVKNHSAIERGILYHDIPFYWYIETGKTFHAESGEYLGQFHSYELIFSTNVTLVVLTVAHLDRIGDICDCEEKTGSKCAIDSHVLALCQKCHLTYDIERHKFNRRRSQAAERGQLWFGDWDSRF